MTIDGIYQKTLFRNIKSGYTFFQFKGLKYDEDGENFYNCRGVIPNYAPKTPLMQMRKNRKRQFLKSLYTK